jgi:predicted DCC family thiol-disulfide oxidoreductase YuxK
VPAATSDSAKPGMVVVYDGDCPFCANYVRLMALQRQTGTVELVDARSADPRVAPLWREGYDLNEGMAVIFGQKVYYGSDAMALISAISGERCGPLGRMLSALLRDPARARSLYPYFKAGRRLTLKLLGRKGLLPAD